MPTHAQRLIHAVRTRNYERLRQLMRERNDLAARSAAGRTALHAAAEEGDREAVRILIDAGADVGARMHNGQTALHLAAAHGGFCDFADPDMDRRNPCGRNRHHPTNLEVAQALTEIIKDKHPHIPSELQAQDKMPEEHKAEMFTAVLECFADPAQLYQQIKSRGIDVDRLDPDFTEHLQGDPRFLGVVELLLDYHADIRAVDNYGASVLRGAVELGRTEMVELLLKRGADPNQQSSPGEPPESLITVALERSRTDVAEVLLRHGAKFDPKAPGLLHEAAANGRGEKVVFWLLDHGAELDQRDDSGDTPLLAAAHSGHAIVLTALIKRGADVRAHNNRGDGILAAAAAWPACLEHVLPFGLPLDEPNREGQTALHLALPCGAAAPVQALLRAGASVNVRDHSGNTPLQCAFLSDECRPDMEFPLFHTLVSAGADRSIRNNEGKTAYDFATERNYPEEYLKLLDPVAGHEPGSFLWLGNELFAGFLPKALVTFELDGVEWPSSDHYFHAQKTRNPEVREQIRQAKTVDAAVCRLRELEVKPSRTWPSRCDAVMRLALLAKFRQHELLRGQLLATGNATLISDAHCDSYWLEQPHAGFNCIGKMLMAIRAELRAEFEGK